MPLNAVAPSTSSQRSLHDFAEAPRTSRVLNQVSTLWNYLKISGLGEYSTERVESLDKYCEQTRFAQVVLIAVLMPVPSLLLSLLVECIPLQDPADGWKHNSGAYLRLCCIVSAGALGSIMQLRTAIKISSLGAVVVVLGTGCGTAALMIMIASLWVFPIPLGISILALPAVILFVLLFLLLVKHQAPGTLQIPSKPLKHPLYLIAAQAILAIIYTFFSVLFARCSRAEGFALLLFLPVMKMILKRLVARVTSGNPDSIPAVVVFTVDVFNGLYSSICIQTSGSWLSLLLVVGQNVFHTILSAKEINRAARYFCLLDRMRRGTIEVYSVKMNGGATVIEPPRRLQTDNSSLQDSHDSQGNVTKLSAKLLFLLEYKALVGYTQAFIPLIYAIYLTALVCMPSSKYYPQSRSLTSEKLQTTIGFVVAYSVSQLLSFAWLHWVVKRKLGFSLLYQLSFVLVTEVEQLQGRLLVWIILVLQLSLEHFGMDFSFEFNWLKNQPPGV